ncbi:hypothetical protein OCAE111667_04970 [Occultella aeris]|uniref:Uncharacterized protein n=1 Tax=Occultella aeris TaxID=2761496 RepID=A0A7M4DFS4_9MICO|nr:hypothetical protein [Occultella aeris]VZO35767.1 hypothetical protein HALOF300_00965 [Occultella aeris]
MSTLEQGDTEPDGEREPVPPVPSALPTPVAAEDGEAPVDQPAVLDSDVVAKQRSDDGPAADEPAPAWAESAEQVSDTTDLDLAAIADRSRVRRAPRFGRFAGFGIALGIIIAFALSRLGEPTEYLDRGGMFILLMAMLAPFGALVACLIAVLLDRTSKRHLDTDQH